MLERIQMLPTAPLQELSGSLLEGVLSKGISSHAIQQVVGAEVAQEVIEELNSLIEQGWSSRQIGFAIEAISRTKQQAIAPEELFDLVISGPEAQEVPTRDTAAVMHSLIEGSMNEVVLVGYAVYKGKLLFEPLATKMSNNPDLKVSFCLNIQRNFGDISLDSEIVKRFAQDFSTNHWPWDPKPELFYDPRALQASGNERASLHAKCLIVDRRIAMITSANFTEAAYLRNVEVGIVTRYEPFVERLATYFDTMKKTVFQRCPLINKQHNQGR